MTNIRPFENLPGPVSIVEPEKANELPIVIDSPHSGRLYPGDFNSIAPFLRLRRAEDAFVDQLVDFAPELGATFVHAHFPRSYVDVNRSLWHANTSMFTGDWPHVPPGDFKTPEWEQGIGLSVQRGLGLFWETIGGDTPIYNRKLPVQEALDRVTNYYRPYRDGLREVIARKIAKFGHVLYLDFHSMSNDGSIAVEKEPVKRPDYYIGDMNGKSADRKFSTRLESCFKESDTTVGLNGFFAGGDLIRSHGNPAAGCHAIMIEINRGNYMDEENVKKSCNFDVQRKQLFLAVQDSIEFFVREHRGI